MSAVDTNDSHLELAHVLFIDIVGYSKRLTNEQSALINNLAMIYAWVGDKESALKQLEICQHSNRDKL